MAPVANFGPVESTVRDYVAATGAGGLARVAQFVEELATELKTKPTAQTEAGAASFVGLARRLHARGNVNDALDLIYDQVDDMLTEGRFEDCDAVLRSANVGGLHKDVLLGLLTSTLPARSRLSERPAFFKRVETSLRERGELKPGLLSGLES